MTPVALTKTRVTTQVGSKTASQVLGECTVAAIGGVGLAVGLWSIACVAAGLMASGGPIAFVRAWFTAVSGV